MVDGQMGYWSENLLGNPGHIKDPGIRSASDFINQAVIQATHSGSQLKEAEESLFPHQERIAFTRGISRKKHHATN
jgi:hypothetical protein